MTFKIINIDFLMNGVKNLGVYIAGAHTDNCQSSINYAFAMFFSSFLIIAISVYFALAYDFNYPTKPTVKGNMKMKSSDIQV